MKAALALMLATVTASGQLFVADFSPTGIRLQEDIEVINGSWSGQIQQHQFSQSVGVNGSAKEDGVAYTQTFPEFNATGGEFEWRVALNYESSLGNDVTITLYDSEGGEASFTDPVGEWIAPLANFVGDLQPDKINQFALGGTGDPNATFVATFHELTISPVPEPATAALFAGVFLAGFAAIRHRFSSPKVHRLS